MTLKKILSHPLFQYSLEIALPIIGYFFFGWSIAVIIAFYFMDYLASEVARHRRHIKIMNHDEKANKNLLALGIGFSFIFFIISLVWAIWNSMLMSFGKSANYLDEMRVFFVEEGWILLPIVYFAYHLKDTMAFYMPRRFTQFDFNRTIKFYLIEHMAMFALVMSGIFCWLQFDIPDIPALLGFIIVKLTFDFLLVKKLKEKTKIQ